MIPTVRTPRPDGHGALSPAPPRRWALPAGAAALALVAAGCGSSGGGSSSSSGSGASSSGGSPSSGGPAATVAVKSEGTLGKILVDGQGRTL